MPRRLDPEILRGAEDAARKPDFAAVLDRGRVLRRRRTATATAATVVVVAGLVGAVQLPDRQEAAPVVPVESPTQTPASPEPTATESPERSGPTAQEIIEDPDSQLVDVKTAPGDPDTRIALWRCDGESCGGRSQAVTLTTDGFRTSTVPDLTWTNALVDITAEGDAVVLDYRRNLKVDVVRPDGSIAEVDMADDVAPVAEGELVAGVEHRARTTIFWATDAASLLAHAVPVPDDTHQLAQTDSGQLRALTRRGTYAWSDDGGATWNESAGAFDEGLLPSFVRSLDETHVVVGGGDGATLFPFQQLRRLDEADSWSVVDVAPDPRAYIGPTAVLPDDRLLASVEAWSDYDYKRPLEGTPPGIYVSAGDDWSTYERVESGAPFETPVPGQPRVIDIDITDTGARLTAIGPDYSTVWTSSDLGATWREMPAR